MVISSFYVIAVISKLVLVESEAKFKYKFLCARHSVDAAEVRYIYSSISCLGWNYDSVNHLKHENWRKDFPLGAKYLIQYSFVFLLQHLKNI